MATEKFEKLSALKSLQSVSKLLQRTPFAPTSGRVILEIDLDRGVLSAAPDNPLAAMRTLNAASMRALRDGLRQAASDDAVKGLVVHVGTCPLSPTQVDELGDLVEKFGEKKPTIAYSETYGDFTTGLLAYRLATRAQQVWLQPTGSLGIGGIHLEIVLLKGGLAKLGVEMQMSKRKEYKSAADQFSADEVSEASREQMARLAESITGESVATIARRRGLDVEAVWDAVNNAPLTPQQALERHLVDHVGYRDEVYAAARREWDVPVDRDADTLRYVHRYGRNGDTMGEFTDLVRKVRPNGSKPAIAVVGVRGGIVDGRPDPTPGPGGPSVGAEEVCEQLRAAGRDEQVKAVVLRVDSPGGSYTASDAIWREVHQLREQGRPVVASMGDYAASGGYYVAMGADEIIANPTTITGSIGVFAGKPVTRELFDKLGLKRESVESGRRAGMMRGDEGFSDDEWRVLNEWLDQVYADFTGKAAADRGMSIDELEPLARGRVWTGADALDRHLVDRLGGMDAAIERACELGGVDRDKAELRTLPSAPLLARFRPQASSESGTSTALPVLGSPWERFAGLGALDLVDAVVGTVAPRGVLSLPWDVRIA